MGSADGSDEGTFVGDADGFLVGCVGLVVEGTAVGAAEGVSDPEKRKHTCSNWTDI